MRKLWLTGALVLVGTVAVATTTQPVQHQQEDNP
jgi:hypothetical protein